MERFPISIESAFIALLDREYADRKVCRFVACPDIVGSARRTLEAFDFWYPRLYWWPLALVAQGRSRNLPIPWELIEGIFIGGSTEWKMGEHARNIIKTAKMMQKWVHIGRVNTPARF